MSASSTEPSAQFPSGIAPPEEHDPARIGPHRVVGRLGLGGMGVVHAALDDRDRRVAVKCVHTTLAADPDFRSRFAREVALVRRVPAHCVPAFLGADTGADFPWLATEYVPGPTLEEHVRQGGVLAGDALTGFALGVAEALVAIHGAGVVHRDLKPGNVILAPDGPKVLDFGIARALEETALTRTGAMVGTPGWISPEQYRGAEASAGSDVFSWGALVAFAANGLGPFPGEHSDATAARILSDEPEIDGLPEQLRAPVSAALAKDPLERPGSDQILSECAALLPDEAATRAAAPRGIDVTRVLERTWRGALPDDELAHWRAHAPPRHPWLRRHRTVVACTAAGIALVSTVALTGTLLLPPGSGNADGGGDPSEPDTAAAQAEKAGVVPEDVPGGYHDLYENGEVVVDHGAGDEVSLVRALEHGGERLEQVRLTVDRAVHGEFSQTRLHLTAEYLPDFGELTVYGRDFWSTGAIDDGDEYLQLTVASNVGPAARLSPQNPVEDFHVDLGGSANQLVHYVPGESGADPAQLPVDRPGGLCIDGGEPGATHGDVEPHDTTLTDGVPQDSCAYRTVQE